MVSDKFSKRLLVVVTDEKYPQTIAIEFGNDNMSKLDSIKPGDNVEVDVNLRGREWEGKYFVSLSGWRIAKVEQGAASDDNPW